MILTRRVADLFADRLIPNKKQAPVSVELDYENKSLTQRVLNSIGLNTLTSETTESEAPIAFTYSLFYVFYDQYTYIRGVLAQNALLGVAAVILSL